MADQTFVDNTTVVNAAGFLQPVNDAVYKGVNPIYVTSGGTANAQTVTLPASVLATVATGSAFTFKAGLTNTGALTLSIIGQVTVAAQPVHLGANALIGGEVRAGDVVTVWWDGTNFQLMPTESLPSLVRAWINFSATGGVISTNQAYGLSVVRNSVGNYTVTITNALAAATYCVSVMGFLSGHFIITSGPSAKSTSAFTFTTANEAATLVDPTEIDVIVVGQR